VAPLPVESQWDVVALLLLKLNPRNVGEDITGAVPSLPHGVPPLPAPRVPPGTPLCKEVV